jgi:hypothetical protein
MALKFSQLPKIGSIVPTTLVPVVDVSLGANVLGVVTGATFTSFISDTVNSSVTVLQGEIDAVVANVSTAQTSVNSLISGAAAASNNINTLQGQMTTAQNNIQTFSGQITTLQSGATATNTAITTANTAMKSYVDARDSAVTTAWTANAAATVGTINTLSSIKANLAGPTFTGTVTLPTTNAGGTITPTANVTYDLGSASAWWNIIYGKAVQAQYADLAEMYLPDAEYAVGTVVMIGGTAEVTACQFGNRAIGAISANPSYLMNSGLEGGVPVALKGRVPVKVIGTVKKGQNLIAGDNGCATAAVYHSSEVFAIALAASDDSGEKLVEALVL